MNMFTSPTQFFVKGVVTVVLFRLYPGEYGNRRTVYYCWSLVTIRSDDHSTELLPRQFVTAVLTSTMAEAGPPHEAAFEAQFEYMVRSIDAGSVAPACLAAGLINDRQREECFRESSSYKKAELLLGYVKRSITGDGTKFDTFIAILTRTGHSRQADILSEHWHALILEINSLS